MLGDVLIYIIHVYTYHQCLHAAYVVQAMQSLLRHIHLENRRNVFLIG